MDELELRDINGINFRVARSKFTRLDTRFNSFVHFRKLCIPWNERNSKFCISFPKKKETWLAVRYHVTEFQMISPFPSSDFRKRLELQFYASLVLYRAFATWLYNVRACLTFAETHTCPPRCNRDTFPPNIIPEFWITCFSEQCFSRYNNNF